MSNRGKHKELGTKVIKGVSSSSKEEPHLRHQEILHFRRRQLMEVTKFTTERRYTSHSEVSGHP